MRLGSLEHGHANAALLPQTAAAMRGRGEIHFERLDVALGKPVETLVEDLRQRAGVNGLGEISSDAELLDRTAAAAAERPELARVAPALERDEVAAIYRAAV